MDFASLTHLPLHAVVAIVAGVVVLLVPRALNYAVAAYLLVIGTLGLLHFIQGHAVRPQAVIAVVAGIIILVRPKVLNVVVGAYLVLVGLLDSGIIR